MSTRSILAPQEDLARASREFEGWRRGRQRGTRIPPSLWQTAVQLARRHGVSRASRALRLDYYQLQRHLHDATLPRGAAEEPRGGFLELALPASAMGPQCRVELEDRGGARLQVDLRGLTAADLGLFVRTVWGRPR